MGLIKVFVLSAHLLSGLPGSGLAPTEVVEYSAATEAGPVAPARATPEFDNVGIAGYRFEGSGVRYTAHTSLSFSDDASTVRARLERSIAAQFGTNPATGRLYKPEELTFEYLTK